MCTDLVPIANISEVWIERTYTSSAIHMSVGGCKQAMYWCYHRLIRWRPTFHYCQMCWLLVNFMCPFRLTWLATIIETADSTSWCLRWVSCTHAIASVPKFCSHMAHHFPKCADCVCKILWILDHVLQNYSSPNFAHFWETLYLLYLYCTAGMFASLICRNIALLLLDSFLCRFSRIAVL